MLCIPHADVEQNVPFMEYGGDSLLAIEVLSQAARLGVPLGPAGALTANFEMLSIQDLVDKAAKSVAAHAVEPAPHAQTAASSAAPGPPTSAKTVILERSALEPGATPKHIGGISACADGDLETARELRLSGWRPACAIDKHGNTPLMWAAGAGHLQVVRWLLEEEAVDVQTSNKQGRTALMWAAKNGQLQVLQWLLQEAPVPRADAKACMKDGSRAWDWAVYGGHLPSLELLSCHPDVDIHGLNHFGCGAAFWAAAAGNVSAPSRVLSSPRPRCVCTTDAQSAAASACLAHMLVRWCWLTVNARGARWSRAGGCTTKGSTSPLSTKPGTRPCTRPHGRDTKSVCSG